MGPPSYIEIDRCMCVCVCGCTCIYLFIYNCTVYYRNTSHILNFYLCGASELRQVIKVAFFFHISSIRIMALTGVHCVFTVETFFKTGESVIATQLSMLISCYVGMMLFRIENWYCYGLKISELQVHQLKENYWEELKDSIFQKLAEILLDMISVLFSTFKNMDSPDHN